jgi:hypothetical protein
MTGTTRGRGRGRGEEGTKPYFILGRPNLQNLRNKINYF